MVHLFRGRDQQNPQENKKASETQVLPETTWADEEMPSGIPSEGSVVITISRQFGSGGTHIGRLVAEKSQLNYFAPLPYRIENVMKHFQLDYTHAAELVEQRDYEFDAYARRFYGADRHQPSSYHLLINTSLFSFDLAASLIQQALPLAKEIG